MLRHDPIFGELLSELPRAETVDHSEVVRTRRLSGPGIGWTDAHLLASALVSKCELWTADAPIAMLADELGVGR